MGSGTVVRLDVGSEVDNTNQPPRAVLASRDLAVLQSLTHGVRTNPEVGRGLIGREELGQRQIATITVKRAAPVAMLGRRSWSLIVAHGASPHD